MNESGQKEIVRETARQAFRREMMDIKLRLPQDWKIRFLSRYKEYDSYKGGVLLTNVLNDKTTDEIVLKGLKEVVQAYELEQQSQEQGEEQK